MSLRCCPDSLCQPPSHSTDLEPHPASPSHGNRHRQRLGARPLRLSFGEKGKPQTAAPRAPCKILAQTRGLDDLIGVCAGTHFSTDREAASIAAVSLGKEEAAWGSHSSHTWRGVSEAEPWARPCLVSEQLGESPSLLHL